MKYRQAGTGVGIRPDRYVHASSDFAAREIVEELNRLRERAEQAERDREVLGGAVLFATQIYGFVLSDQASDAMYRCTPASREGA